MKRKIFITLLFLLSFVASSYAQTNGQKAQAQFKYVTALPATCAPNSSLIYAVIGASPFRYYVCGATPNTFTELTNTASGTTPGGADTNVQYNDAGTLAGDANFTWNKTSRTATLTGGTVTLNLTGVSDATATIYGAGARLGNSGGTIYPFVGGGQNTGPGTRWSDGTNMSGLYISNGLIWQGHNSTHDPFKIRKGTSGTSDGAMIFEFRPSSAYFQLYPFDTTAGSTTPIKFTELAANGTNFTAIKAADAITNDATIVLPINNAPSTNDVLTVTGVSGGVVTTAWQAAAGGTTINSTNGVIPVRSNATTFIDSPFSVSSGRTTHTPTAASSGVASYNRFLTPADTGQTASTESIGIQFGGNTSAATVTRQWSTGALTTQREYTFVAPTYGFVGASTCTTCSTVSITGAPIAGTNATLTNALALNIESGQTRFPNGSASAPSISIGSNTYGFYRGGGAGNALVAAVNGAAWVTFADANSGAGIVVEGDRPIGWGTASSGSLVSQFSGEGTGVIRFGAKADVASPVAYRLKMSGVIAGTSNTAGANLTIAGSIGTGTGTGGALIFETTPSGSSGTSQNTSTEAMRITGQNVIQFPTTITAGGTTGNQTIDKVSGTVNFAAAATSLTVTNNKVTTTSICFAVVRTNDSTATIKNVVPGSGSFVINLGAAATAETSVGFFCINP